MKWLVNYDKNHTDKNLSFISINVVKNNKTMQQPTYVSVSVFTIYWTTRNALGCCYETMMKSVDTCEVVLMLIMYIIAYCNKHFKYSVNE